MRIALLAESFLPHMNGVTHSVMQMLRHFERRGHEALVLAPHSGEVVGMPETTQLELLRSVGLPKYPEVRLTLASVRQLRRELRSFEPDALHLASPFLLGWQGVVAADQLRLPTVAVYQTDVPGYAERYGVPSAAPALTKHLTRLHRRATLTLAPSQAAHAQLQQLGIDRLRMWARGVDSERFTPEKRDERWRAEVAPGKHIVGYVGRLAAEKQVADLHVLADLPGTQLVIVGDGPLRAELERTLPNALFLGFQSGDDLARIVASCDVFVHPGEHETFCQTVQEALASGVPVVATGAGGPLDLVQSSVTGWLYQPGDLAEMRARVEDLLGDASKRAAFGRAARASIHGRSWEALGDRLLEYYGEAAELRQVDDGLVARRAGRPSTVRTGPVVGGWRSYVALGDSITEGLCDTSRVGPGEFRGWADRLATLLANRDDEQLDYANLAVRSRRVNDVIEHQIPAAIALKPELVSVLIGANNLVRWDARPVQLVAQLRDGIRQLKAAGSEVLLVTPFLPRRKMARLVAARFARYNQMLRELAAAEDVLFLDLEALPELGQLQYWAADAVHLNAAGHRLVAYRAAERLSVPHAEVLSNLEAMYHDIVLDIDVIEEPDEEPGSWFFRHCLPWLIRRIRGKTAGDGLSAKHDSYITLGRGHTMRSRSFAS